MRRTYRKYWHFVDIGLFLSLMLPSCGSNSKQDMVSSPNTPKTVTPPPAIAFGKDAWEDYLGAVGEEPALPSNIDEILDGACPFWPERKVKETHLLVLIPATVDGKPFTLNLLGELVKSPKQGHKTSYSSNYSGSTTQKNFGEMVPSQHTYWVLMTREVADTSKRNKNSQRNHPEYNEPTILEAATAILVHYIRSSEWLYQTTHTYCRENITKSSKETAQTVFVGKSSTADQLDIGHKSETVVRFASEDGTEDLRGRALLREL